MALLLAKALHESNAAVDDSGRRQAEANKPGNAGNGLDAAQKQGRRG